MDDRGQARLMLLLMLAVSVPVLGSMGLVVHASLKSGNWPFAVMLLAVLPTGLLAWAIGRWINRQNTRDLTGTALRQANFRAAYLQVVPLIFINSFIGLTPEMTWPEALHSVASHAILIALITLVGFMAVDTVVARFVADDQ